MLKTDLLAPPFLVKPSDLAHVVGHIGGSAAQRASRLSPCEARQQQLQERSLTGFQPGHELRGSRIFKWLRGTAAGGGNRQFRPLFQWLAAAKFGFPNGI